MGLRLAFGSAIIGIIIFLLGYAGDSKQFPRATETIGTTGILIFLVGVIVGIILWIIGI